MPMNYKSVGKPSRLNFMTTRTVLTKVDGGGILKGVYQSLPMKVAVMN
jgi:hypothetical protein